jgi:poly-gamma-glutamate synthesis protein (capsule biosynthesis protein)
VNAAGVEENDDIAIIPCHTSSINGSNNYQPTPVTGEEATSIMTIIDQISAVFAQSYSQYMLDGTTIE